MTPLQTHYRRIRKYCRALDAYRAAQFAVQREVKWRLLGLPEVPNSPVTGWSCEVMGYTVNINFQIETDCGCFSDSFEVLYKTDQPKQRNDCYKLDSVTGVRLKDWTESDAYRNWTGQKYGKAEARRRAISDRCSIVSEAYDLNRGNTAYYWVIVECEALEFTDNCGCLQDTDSDGIENFLRDALESVLHKAQSVKEAA